jgi:4-amino-4-deoxy-L-arabinose transferase-like glycosyltransferase
MQDTKPLMKRLLVGVFFIILFYFLYLNKLEKVPPGFYIDESLPGYNAYSILKTGKDEWGKVFPVVFRFFRLYNPPLFVYLNVLTVLIFGLNVFAIRIISVFIGGAAIITYYFLLKHSKLIKTKTVLFWSVAFFAITPWMVFYSRIGFEVILAFYLFFLGVYFFWRYVEKRKYLTASYFFLSLSTYAAYTQRILVPIFLLTSAILFKKKLFNKRSYKKFLVAILVFLAIQIPYLTIIKTPAFFPKGDMLGLSSYGAQVGKVNLFLPNALSSIVVFVRELLSQYVTYFSPRSLFFLPDPDIQRSIPELSVFYFWMIIPYLLGLYVIWKKRSDNFIKLTVLLLLISMIPASLTHDPFATHRAMPMLLPLSIVISLGLNKLMGRHTNIQKIFLTAVVFLLSLVILWRSYFVLFANERAIHWQYGVDQLSAIITSNPDRIFVIDQARRQPIYTTLAFFMNYPPSEFQNEIDQSVKDNYYKNIGANGYEGFGNVETRNIYWENDSKKKQVLVGDEYTFSQEQVKEHKLNKLFEIKSPVNEILYVGYETNPGNL